MSMVRQKSVSFAFDPTAIHISELYKKTQNDLEKW